MSENSIARKDVRFPEQGIGSQALIEAVENVLKHFESEAQGLFEHWASRRWINGRQSFRLGLRDLRRTIHGQPEDPSYDILILPNDGKETDWFRTDDRIFSVEVCTRQQVDDFTVPLRDINSDEEQMAVYVGIVAALLDQSVKESLGED